MGDRSLDTAQPYSVTFSSSYHVGQSSVVKRGKFSRKCFRQSRHYHDRKPFQCWSLPHQSQCMCTHPACANICCHTDSCPPSLPEVKQWYLTMESFVNSRHTYCGRILSWQHSGNLLPPRAPSIVTTTSQLHHPIPPIMLPPLHMPLQMPLPMPILTPPPPVIQSHRLQNPPIIIVTPPHAIQSSQPIVEADRKGILPCATSLTKRRTRTHRPRREAA